MSGEADPDKTDDQMSEIEFVLEREKIFALESEPALVATVETLTKRRQMASAQHGALIGFALIRGIEKGWVPKGGKPYEEYCWERFGYKVTQCNRFRRLARDWELTRRANQFVLDNLKFFSDQPEITVPEVGTVAFADKAIKALTAHNDALKRGLDASEAMNRAAEALSPTPVQNNFSLKERYQMAVALLLIAVHRNPELVEDVLMGVARDINVQSMAHFDEWTKQAVAGVFLTKFFVSQYEVFFGELDPPWDGDEADFPKRANPRKRQADVPPKQKTETDTRSEITLKASKAKPRQKPTKKAQSQDQVPPEEQEGMKGEIIQLLHSDFMMKDIYKTFAPRRTINAWRKADPKWDAAIEAILAARNPKTDAEKPHTGQERIAWMVMWHSAARFDELVAEGSEDEMFNSIGPEEWVRTKDFATKERAEEFAATIENDVSEHGGIRIGQYKLERGQGWTCVEEGWFVNPTTGDSNAARSRSLKP